MKRILTVITLALMTLTQVYAEKSKTEQQADEAYKLAKFDEAIKKYESTKDNITVEGQRKLARAYQNYEDFTNAARVFEKIIKDEYADQDDYWNYVVVLKQLKEYGKANQWMTEFAKSSPEDLRTKSFLRSGIGNTVNNTDRYQIKDLTFNDASSDFSPAYYGSKMDKVIFTTNRDAKGSDGFSDLSIASVSSTGQFVDIKKLDDINTKWHEGVASVTADGQFMAYTTNDYKDKKSLQDSKLQLMFAKMQSNGKWGQIESFKLNSPNYSTGHPSLSANGKIMYFASDKPGGFGGIDIYRVEKQPGGEWGDPVNMGNKINTEGDEMFPFYDETTKTLYYSSNGLSGFGGLDVYMAKDGQLPVNMGAPINTERDDFGFIINKDQKSGYFSSNRPTGKGSDDIYYYTVSPIVLPTVAMNDKKYYSSNSPLNTNKNDFAAAYYGNPSNLIIASDRNPASSQSDLYVAPVTGHCQFGSVKALDELNTRSYEGPASVTADGKYMAFTKTTADVNSNDFKYQLYFANRRTTADKWTNIESSKLNHASYSIAFPYLSADGNTLYFSSDMPGGYGGMDLYKSQKTSAGEWGSPVNLGKGVNTTGDEIYPFVDEKHNYLYFSSDVLGTLGGFDVIRATIKGTNFTDLVNMNTPINSSKDDYGFIIAQDGTGYVTSNRDGGKGEYDIYCISDVEKKDPTTKDLDVKVNKDGKLQIDLHNVYYNLGKWDLLPASYVELNILANYLKDHSEFKVEVGSHTDSRGSDAANMTLSQKRSQSVVNYMVSQGIARDRMIARGYGETMLVNRCSNGVKCTEVEHAANRRTEFIVLNSNYRTVKSSEASSSDANAAAAPTNTNYSASTTAPAAPSASYVVLASFAQKTPAAKVLKDLAAMGEKGVILESDGRYRVAVPCTEDNKQATLVRLKPTYSGAWIYNIK